MLQEGSEVHLLGPSKEAILCLIKAKCTFLNPRKSLICVPIKAKRITILCLIKAKCTFLSLRKRLICVPNKAKRITILTKIIQMKRHIHGEREALNRSTLVTAQQWRCYKRVVKYTSLDPRKRLFCVSLRPSAPS